MINKFHTSDICEVNRKDVYHTFSALLKEKQVVAGSIKGDIYKSIGLSSLKASNREIQFGELKLIFYVSGETKELCDLNTSNLVAECDSCIIKMGDERFEYVSFLSSVSITETGVDFYNQVDLTFSMVKRLPQVVVPIKAGTGTYRNEGNLISGAVFAITPKVNIDNLIINGVTVKNLVAGQVFIIDGLEGKVTCNGVNRFLDTDLIEFPEACPGMNSIVSSSNEVDIEVSFYPTFIV